MTHEELQAMATRQADLTDEYKAALKLLRACNRSYSQEKYRAAMTAVQRLADHDEIEDLNNIADKLFAYAKVANDETLERLAAKAGALHRHAATQTLIAAAT